MLGQKEIYNNSYSHFTPDYIELKNISKINQYLETNSESLKDFITKYFSQFSHLYSKDRISVLELGCGVGSLSYFLKENFEYYTGIDFSNMAIATARSIAELKNVDIDFKVMDVTNSDERLELKYDCLIDSHLFHCLTTENERIEYLNFAKSQLKENGQLLIECMTFQPKLQIPVGYSFDESYVLSKQVGDEYIPVRSILTSRSIEDLLKEMGFEINYLYYHNELSFDVFEEYLDYPQEFLPKTLRLSATLK